MYWCGYGVSSTEEDKRTKDDLRNEIANLINENRTLWFMLKERCPDLSYEELSKKVDDKIKEENDRIEKGRKFIEQYSPIIAEADEYFGNNYGENKVSLRIAYFLSKRNGKLDNEILNKNLDIAKKSDDGFLQIYTIARLFSANNEYVKSFNLGDDFIMYLMTLCGNFIECDEIKKGGTD